MAFKLTDFCDQVIKEFFKLVTLFSNEQPEIESMI